MRDRTVSARKWLTVAVLILAGCARQEAAQVKSEKTFHEQQLKIIYAHRELLAKAGHMSRNFAFPEIYLGSYGWYDGTCDEYGESGPCSFGAYVFSQAAFEQAKAGWFLGGAHVLEGSNELWLDEDYIKFDDSVVGRTITLSMAWFENGKFKTAWFTAKIIGLHPPSSPEHGLLLDKRAPHAAEMHHLAILPAGYVDMCNCTSGGSTTTVTEMN